MTTGKQKRTRIIVVWTEMKRNEMKLKHFGHFETIWIEFIVFRSEMCVCVCAKPFGERRLHEFRSSLQASCISCFLDFSIRFFLSARALALLELSTLLLLLQNSPPHKMRNECEQIEKQTFDNDNGRARYAKSKYNCMHRFGFVVCCRRW